MGAQSFIKFSEEEEVNQKVSPENISESDQDEAQESSSKEEDPELVAEEDKLIGKDLPSKIISEAELIRLLDITYDSLNDDQALEIWVFQDYVLVGIRKRGHGDDFKWKFINYGFSPTSKDRKSEKLSNAIRAIDGGSLREYCYDAINGNIDALKKTTMHEIKSFRKKLKRLYEKGKSIKMIMAVRNRLKKAKESLNAPLNDFLKMSEPIMIEIPKNVKVFYNLDPDGYSHFLKDDLDEDDEWIENDPIDNDDYVYTP